MIHGDIKPENVVIWNSGTEITLKWADFESPLHYDESKMLESETNIEKATGSTFSIEHSSKWILKNPQKTTDETHTILQKLRLKEESKINIEKRTEQMRYKEFLEDKTKYFTSKKSRTWQAPELQTLSNPQSLATFGSDVFAAGLVFGSLLLNGAHPFGLNEDEITSNIKMNNPVNVGSKSLLFQDFISYALPL
jgi:serine/threonine protein kinase